MGFEEGKQPVIACVRFTASDGLRSPTDLSLSLDRGMERYGTCTVSMTNHVIRKLELIHADTIPGHLGLETAMDSTLVLHIYGRAVVQLLMFCHSSTGFIIWVGL